MEFGTVFTAAREHALQMTDSEPLSSSAVFRNWLLLKEQSDKTKIDLQLHFEILPFKSVVSKCAKLFDNVWILHLDTRVTVKLTFLPCYRRYTLISVVLTLIQDCERHRYLQSSNILSDNIPIKSYIKRVCQENELFQVRNENMKCRFIHFFLLPCGEHSTADGCFITLFLQTQNKPQQSTSHKNVPRSNYFHHRR